MSAGDPFEGEERRDPEQPATAGAQKQIDAIRKENARDRKLMRGALKALAAAGVIFIATVTVVVTLALDAIHTAEQERAKRVESVSDVIGLFCDTNNAQDRALAKLVRVSLAGGGGGDFGEGIDPSTLSDFDLMVLATIAKVSAAQQQGPDLQDVFRETLRELDDLTPCLDIVQRYLAGEPVPSLDELNAQATTARARAELQAAVNRAIRIANR